MGDKEKGSENRDSLSAWQSERQKLKEWKWKDIDLEDFVDYNFKYILGWIVITALFLMPFIDVILDAILIRQMYDVRENLQQDVSLNRTQDFCSPNATRTTIVYNARSDSIFPCDLVIVSLLVMIISYAAFALLSVIFTIYDLWWASRIVKSDDVSDSYIDQIGYRMNTMRWYSHFCVFKAIESEQSYTDQAVIFVYQTLRNGKQLVADIPHFIIALVFSFLIYQLNTSNLADRNTITNILKLALLVFRLGCLIGCVIAYPFLRCCVAKASLQKYASFLIEKRIATTLWSQLNKFSNLPTNTTGVSVVASDTPGSPSSPPLSQPLVSSSDAPPTPPLAPHYGQYPPSPPPSVYDPNYPPPPPPSVYDPNYPPPPPAGYDPNYPPTYYSPPPSQY